MTINLFYNLLRGRPFDNCRVDASRGLWFEIDFTATWGKENASSGTG